MIFSLGLGTVGLATAELFLRFLCQCHKTSKNVGEHHPQSEEDQGAGNGIKDAINGIYHGRTACTSSILVLTLMVIHSILGTSPVAGIKACKVQYSLA